MVPACRVFDSGDPVGDWDEGSRASEFSIGLSRCSILV